LDEPASATKSDYTFFDKNNGEKINFYVKGGLITGFKGQGFEASKIE
jgi:hypothetical protein